MKNVFITLILLLPVIIVKAQWPEDRPNIIFILTDDQRWDELGYAGNDILQTPNMDQLAHDGVYFSHAFVTTPICAASRASIATGLYERSHGFTFGMPPLRKEFIEISYFNKLKEAGYYTGFLGKFGMSFENSMDEELFDVYDAYYSDFYFRLAGKGGTSHAYLTYITGEKAERFIDEVPRDRPFCLSISFNAPHAEDRSPDQYIYPKNLAHLYTDTEIPEPVLGENFYYLQQPEFVRTGMNRIRWLWRFDTPEKYQNMVKAYYRMITAVDQVLGRLRSQLKRNKLADNTIIILMGDNGYFLGERGFAGKWLLYDNSIRVPLIIYDPRNAANGHNVDKIALNIDISPTILDLANINIPEIIQGRSLTPFLKGEVRDWRNSFFCEHLFDNPFIPKSEGIRTTQWKYFRYIEHPGSEELYDLVKDPLETNNLAGNPEFMTQKQLFSRQCDQMISELSKVNISQRDR